MYKNYKKSSLQKKRKWPIKYILVFFVLLGLLFTNNSLYQYTFGYLGNKLSFLGTQIKEKLSQVNEKLVNSNDLETLRLENERLMRENSQLKENILSNGIVLQNENVATNFNLEEADVIGKDNFFDAPILMINQGEEQQIRPGMAVVDDTGIMIGKIQRTTRSTSYIALTSNITSRITAIIAGTDYNGVLEGSKNLRALLEMLPIESKIDTNAEVVTDNTDPGVPSGLLLGKVSEVKESDDRLFKEAVLDLPWDGKKIRKVWIIKDRK